MKMTMLDQVFLAITAWKENRGGGLHGMQSVINAILNRCSLHHSLPYEECVKRLQFSSLTAPGDPELVIWPERSDPAWETAQSLVGLASLDTLVDITEGASDYYAKNLPAAEHKLGKTFTLPSGEVIPYPDGWREGVLQFTAEIAGQVFFKPV